MPFLRNKFTVFLFLLGTLFLVAAGNCKKDEKSGFNPLLLMGLLPSSGGGEACKNQSGLVICIPPGFRM